ATEAACDEAMEELQEAKAKCMALRGAEDGAEPPAAPPGGDPPPADQARALARASSAQTTEAHLETARLAAFGRHVLERLGLSAAEPVKAKGILGARLDLAAEADQAKKSEAKARKGAEAARREKLWEQAVRDRRVQLAQAFRRVDGPNGKPVRVYAEWAEKQ